MNNSVFREVEDWFESSWNPVTGCTPHSEGCRNCYAKPIALRKFIEGDAKYRNGFRCTLHPELLKRPPPACAGSIFVCSMSDLFQDAVPDSFIKSVFDFIARHPKRHFHVLTKRAERLAKIAPHLPWGDNLWAGVTVEEKDHVHRADELRKVPAVLRYIYAEPLLSPLKGLDLSGIGTIVIGGESGPGSREMKKEWVLELQEKCNKAGTIFYMKQWGDHPRSGGSDRIESRRGGCLLDGKEYKDRPELFKKPVDSHRMITESLFD